MLSLAEVILAASAGFVLYVLFGYPLLLWLVARKKARPVAACLEPRTVTVLLPVYNGERWIRDKLLSILNLDYPRRLMEILVISDGSTDRTDEIARSFAVHGVRLLRVERSGKAGALNAGIQAARGEILFFTDVRQELAPDCLKILVASFADPQVGVAGGELMIRGGRTREEADIGLYWKYEKQIRLRQSSIDSVLGVSGCCYAMRRSLTVPMPADTLLDDVYLPLAAFFRGYRIVLTDARVFDDPTDLKREFGRKVRTLAGVYQMIRRYPALLGPGNRMWVHFMSHKVGRLGLPYALVAALVSSFWLPPAWAVGALVGQAAFYALAGLDFALPEGLALKRVSSPVRTFVVMMGATVCALAILFCPAQKLWKSPEPPETPQVRRAAA